MEKEKEKEFRYVENKDKHFDIYFKDNLILENFNIYDNNYYKVVAEKDEVLFLDSKDLRHIQYDYYISDNVLYKTILSTDMFNEDDVFLKTYVFEDGDWCLEDYLNSEWDK